MIKIHSYIIWQRPKNFRFILTKGTEFIIGHLKAWTLVTFLIYKIPRKPFLSQKKYLRL